MDYEPTENELIRLIEARQQRLADMKRDQRPAILITKEKKDLAQAEAKLLALQGKKG